MGTISGWTDLVGLSGVSVLVEDDEDSRVSFICDDFEGAPDDDSVLDAVEALTGRWYKLGEWQPSGDQRRDGLFEVVASLKLEHDQPTHRITFKAPGAPARVEFVHLYDDGDGTGPAYSRREWTLETSASWGVGDEGWRCEGQVTPGGANGSVTVERL